MSAEWNDRLISAVRTRIWSTTNPVTLNLELVSRVEGGRLRLSTSPGRSCNAGDWLIDEAAMAVWMGFNVDDKEDLHSTTASG